MTVGLRELNRATLARQLLLERHPLDVPDAVGRVVVLQAQEPASPYVALWNRVTDLEPAAVDAAFRARDVVKASLVRLTLHAVHARDYPPFHSAMLPSLRAARLSDRRFTDTGLSKDDAARLLPDLVDFVSVPRTGAEIERMLAERFGEEQPRLWWALKMFAPLHHAPTSAPWSFASRSSFVAAGTDRAAHETAVPWLVRRYLEGFGPASVRDVTQFSLLRRPVVRDALEALDGEVEQLTGPDGEVLFDVAGAPRPSGDTPAPPRLLGMWESILLAYADRSRVIPPEHRSVVIRRNGDVLPTLLVDGHVAGIWRAVEEGIEVRAFQRLHDDTWEALASEARALVAFLADRDPPVYRRHARWWEQVDGVVDRLLPA